MVGPPLPRTGLSCKLGERQYVPMPHALLKSDAWRSLSGAAVKVFLELHTRYNGSNNGKVRLSMNEATATARGHVSPTNDWRNWRPKTDRGSETDPSAPRPVPPQNPRQASGSATEPVSASFARGFGSGMEH